MCNAKHCIVRNYQPQGLKIELAEKLHALLDKVDADSAVYIRTLRDPLVTIIQTSVARETSLLRKQFITYQKKIQNVLSNCWFEHEKENLSLFTQYI